MTVAQELDDLRAALALARATRAATGQGPGPLALVGFSHGAQLAYAYAAAEGARPPAQRHVDALAPLDFYASFAPEDEPLRAQACASAAFGYELVAAGGADAPNDFLIAAGRLRAVPALPDDPPSVAASTHHESMVRSPPSGCRSAGERPSESASRCRLHMDTAGTVRPRPGLRGNPLGRTDLFREPRYQLSVINLHVRRRSLASH